MQEAIDVLTREDCEFLGTMILPRSSICVHNPGGRPSCPCHHEDQQLLILGPVLGSTIEIWNMSQFIMVPDSFLCFCNMKSCEDMVWYVRSVGSLTDRADIDLSKIAYMRSGDGRLVLYDYRHWKRLIFWQYRLVNSLGLWFSQVLVFEFTILGGFLSISPWGSIALDSWPRARIYDRNTGHVRLYNGSRLVPLLL